MDRVYQIILYGATGFTGKLCAEYLRDNYPEIKWAIAGRDSQKLNDLKNTLNLNCDIYVASGDDKESIDNFVSKTRVVLSTAGPFARYSNLIVKSCVENKTHYTDITGENHWVKDLIDWGPGPRACQQLILGSKVRALLNGRFAAKVEDVKAIAHPVLRHRIVPTFNAEAEGITVESIIDRCIEGVPEKKEAVL